MNISIYLYYFENDENENYKSVLVVLSRFSIRKVQKVLIICIELVEWRLNEYWYSDYLDGAWATYVSETIRRTLSLENNVYIYARGGKYEVGIKRGQGERMGKKCQQLVPTIIDKDDFLA